MKTRLILVLSLLTILLAACNLPETIKQNPEKQQITQHPEMNLTQTVTPTMVPIVIQPPSCVDAYSFGNLIGVSPGDLSIQPLNPQFTWYYNVRDFWNKDSADPWAEVCVPETYELYFSTGPDFTDEFSVQVANPVAPFVNSSNLPVNWMITSALEPVKVYHWLPVGHYGTVDIGISKIASLHDETKWLPVSDQWFQGTFRTGPECTSGNIDIPVLNSPAAGATINSQQPKIIWETTSCMPLVFQIQILKFTDQSLWFQGQTNYPWWYLYTTNAGSSFPQLADCTKYSWRVMGGIDVNGTREWGELSELRTFTVNSGSCLPPPAPPMPTKTPTLTPTAPPEPVSVDCGSISDATSCNNNSACQWIPNVSCPTCGSCVNK